MKYSIYAWSSVHVSALTSLYNKTAHSTLISNCSSIVSYGFANNKKVLNGSAASNTAHAPTIGNLK
jgi:hypothetical protein